MTATDDRQAADLLGGEAGPDYRPDLNPANADVRSWVYLVHLDPPYKHAAHYTGSAEDLAQRLRQHGTGDGARLLEVQRQAGGSWHVARTWPGGQAEEYALKRARMAARICPTCSPGTRRGSLTDIRRSAERDHARWLAERQAQDRDAGGASPDGDEVLLTPQARGREDAARFLSIWDGASADEIEQAAAECQTPYYEGDRTPEGDAQQGAFAEVVTAAIEARREQERAQSAAAAQPQEVPEVRTDTAQERAPEAPAPTEREKGAATARLIVLRQIETGQSAEQIADRWEAALTGHDPGTATPEQQAWHDGAREEAAQLIQDWRDMQREEAEQAQAARDAREAAAAQAEQAQAATGDGGGKTCGCDYDACRSGELPSALRTPGRAEPEPDPEPELEAV